MTGKARFLTAMRNEIPDRVPVTPDISNYIPALRTGLPFWEIYFEDRLPLWRAYIDAAEYFDLDMWIGSCFSVPTKAGSREEIEEELSYDQDRDAMLRTRTWHTRDGDLKEVDLCFRQEPPTHTKRMVEDLERDWPRLRSLLLEPRELDSDLIDTVRAEMHRRDQAFGMCLSYPGFQHWEGFVEGSIETLSYGFMDNPAILDEWAEIDLETGTHLFEEVLRTSPDYITLGGSGTLTLASPELARRYALPAIQKWSDMAHQAGVPTVLHSCGKSQDLIRMLAEETQVSCVNPLEVAPMGDVVLADVKRAYGSKIALMGNLHTTDLMLRGTPEQVYHAAGQAIRDAGEDGGFILSTGDQCPPHTPEENLKALHHAVRDFGTYSVVSRNGDSNLSFPE